MLITRIINKFDIPDVRTRKLVNELAASGFVKKQSIGKTPVISITIDGVRLYKSVKNGETK